MTTGVFAPQALVQGAPRAPLPFGLFSVVSLRHSGVDRWENGVTFEQLPVEAAGGFPALNSYTAPDFPTLVPVDDFIGNDFTGAATPFVVYGDFKASPVGWSPADAEARALQQLLAREEARVEKALWTGDLGNTPNFSGTNGFASPTNTVEASVMLGAAYLEQKIAEEYGSLGIMHMARSTALKLLSSYAAYTSGGRLLTLLGTPIVAGAGYSATNDKIVVTPALFGYSSDTASSSGRAGDLLDRLQNDLYARVDREYLLGFDDCPLFSTSTA